MFLSHIDVEFSFHITNKRSSQMYPSV